MATKPKPKSKPVPAKPFPMTPLSEIKALLKGKRDPQIHLVVIDGQWDFCAPTDAKPAPALPVAGAAEDMERVATMMSRLGRKLSDVHLTFDSHHAFHIAHPIAWVDAKGNHPAPFTIISADDVEKGVWRASLPDQQKRFLKYVQQLAANKRYPLCVWPPHCLIGSHGFQLMPSLFEAVRKWEVDNVAVANKVTKGSNPFTEHYSALQADVPDSGDPATQLNVPFVEMLERADVVLLAGEAGSHCLSFTVRDVAAAFQKRATATVGKLVLLTDATSPVPGFEANQTAFIKDLVAQGMKLATTDTVFV